MFTFKKKVQHPWEKFGKLGRGVIYGGFGLSTFLSVFVLRRMLQVKYYKQLEAHEHLLKAQKMKTVALIALLVIISVVVFTPAGNHMAASIFTVEH